MFDWLAQLPELKPLHQMIVGFVAVAAGLLVLRSLIFRRLRKRLRLGDHLILQRLVEDLAMPSVFWAFTLALYVALQAERVPKKYQLPLSTALTVILVLSVTLSVANLAAALARQALKEGDGSPVSGLHTFLIRSVVFATGGLFMARALGLELSPLLTALGVGGLAVALALQETLTSFIAGAHILVERPFQIGHYIRLDSGQEGYVVDISWRTTRLKNLLNHVVVVPNRSIAGTTLTNFHLPSPTLKVDIPIRVAYDSDPDEVEEALLKVVERAIEELPFLSPDPPPDVTLVQLGEYGMEFNIRVNVREYADGRWAVHHLHKRVIRRFRELGLHIPFPTQIIHIDDSPRAGGLELPPDSRSK